MSESVDAFERFCEFYKTNDSEYVPGDVCVLYVLET